MPAMLLTDGVLGQMMEPVQFPKISVKPSDKPWAIGINKKGSGKNYISSLYLVADKLQEVNWARDERYAKIERELPDAEKYLTDDAEIVLVAYGASARISRSAINLARKEGIKAGMVRPKTLWPFPKAIIADASKNAKVLLAVELNSGQMVDDVKLAVDCKKPVEFFGRTGGVIPSPKELLADIKKIACAFDTRGGTK
jgi:2-oxoglutarate ferredoxin oxidoreductase subunit alpha